MKNKKIIVGNWKMNPETAREARQIFSGLKKLAKSFKKTELVVCPPFIHLSHLSAFSLKLSNFNLGAQNTFWEKKGSFTGEISISMLKDLKVKYVILGHSERRALGETDEMVNKKVRAVLKEKMIPVLCIGEKERDTDGKFFEFLRNQIKQDLSKVKKSELSRVIIAYEPVWAIGKSEKEYMKGEEIHQMSIFIRKVLSDFFGKKYAWKPKIIYGGSATSFNVSDIISKGQVDGILPGRASLDPKEMKEILKILESGSFK